jgi:hypothetical protein
MKNEENPIFITGLYRSGTTYLSRILDAHPQLDISYDSINYFRWCIKRTTNPNDYRAIVDEVAKRIFDRYKRKIDSKQIVTSLESLNCQIGHAEIYSEIMKNYFSYSGNRWGEKTLMEWSNIPTFLSLYPSGRAIHIIRDPRDVLSSYKKMTIETGDKYLDSVFASMHSLDSAVKYINTLPKDKYYLIKYESLIANPLKEVEKLCDFVGVNFDSSMLDSENYKGNFGEKFTKDTHSSYIDGVNNKLMERWKDQLDGFEIEFIEGFLSIQMIEFGYELSNDKNILNRFVDTIKNEPILLSRFNNYLSTNSGIEAYPSDPTLKDNWGDSGILGKGAALAYGKKVKKIL